MTKREADTGPSTQTTGHAWDGIEELNTPLPRWWLWTFYATIVWAFAYWIFYPAWPTISGYTTGVLGYTNRGQVAVDLADLQAIRGAKGAALQQVSLADIEKDPALLAFAQAEGKAAFGTIARRATAWARPAPRAIRTSTTTIGCGAAPSRGSS